MRELLVEKVYEGQRVTHWRCSRGEAGEAVTVRMGEHGVYCCLTCRVIDCIHVEAVRSFDHRTEPSAVAEETAA